MTTQIQKDTDSNVVLCTAKDVEAYIKQNPEFFMDNPQLLADMEIPHSSGNAVSLIERQVAVLRQENKQLRGRIKDLVEIAKENENLIAKLHKLNIALIETKNVQQFVDVLNAKLRDDFSAFGVSVKLYKEAFDLGIETESFVSKDEEELKTFSKFLSHTNPVCGRFTQEQVNYLFPEIAEDIKSMALVPLISDEPLGLFAIASDDSERFKAGMSTSFLSTLSDAAASVLQRFR